MFALLLLKSFFGLLPNLLADLCIAKRTICGLAVLCLWFRLLDSRIFYCSALALYLGRGDVSGTISLQSLVVYLPDIGSRLEACLGLSFNCFLDHLFLGIPFSAPLFYLGFYRRLKAFPEESNKFGLF